MQVGTRVRISDTAGAYAGREGTIVALKRSAPVGMKWAEVKAMPKNSAEVRLDDGTTPWAMFKLDILTAI